MHDKTPPFHTTPYTLNCTLRSLRLIYRLGLSQKVPDLQLTLYSDGNPRHHQEHRPHITSRQLHTHTVMNQNRVYLTLYMCVCL